MMPQRLALTTAAVAATVVLTIGLVAAGFAPIPPGQPAAAGLDELVPVEDAAAAPLEPEVVYVKPAPTPETIVLRKQAQAAGSGSSGTGTRAVRSEEREHEAEERAERRKEEREAERERRKEAAERAGERREREDDDD